MSDGIGEIVREVGKALTAIATGGLAGCAPPPDETAAPTPASAGTGTPSPSGTPLPGSQSYGYSKFVSQTISGNPYVGYACGDQYTGESGQATFDSLCTVTLKGTPQTELKWEVDRTQVLDYVNGVLQPVEPKVSTLTELAGDYIPDNMTPLAAKIVSINGYDYHVISYTGSSYQGVPEYQGLLVLDPDGGIVKEYDLSVLQVDGKPVTGASSFYYDEAKDELYVLAHNYDVDPDSSEVTFRASALIRIQNPLSEQDAMEVYPLSDASGKAYQNASAMGRDSSGSLVIAAVNGTVDGKTTGSVLLKWDHFDAETGKAVVSEVDTLAQGIGINGIVQGGEELVFTGYGTSLAARSASGIVRQIPTGVRGQAVFTGNAAVDSLNLGNDGAAIVYASKPGEEVSLQFYLNGSTQFLSSIKANTSLGPIMLGVDTFCWGAGQTGKTSTDEDVSQLECFSPAVN